MFLKNMNENKYFKTTTFYLAAFLFAKGLELVSVDKITDSRRAYFVFVDSPLRELWVERFNFGKEDDQEVMVDVRKMVTAVKTLKEKLYQE